MVLLKDLQLEYLGIFYLQDGLHLNNKGYQVIIKKLKKLLKKID